MQCCFVRIDITIYSRNRQSWLVLAGSHDTCGHRPRATQNIFNGLCDGPSNDDFKSLLTLFSTQLTKRYFVVRVMQCPPGSRQLSSNTTTPLYSVAKPLARRRNESAGSVSEEWSCDELQGEMKGDQVNLLMTRSCGTSAVFFVSYSLTACLSLLNIVYRL